VGFLSQSGQLILKTQAVQGTYDSTTGTAGIAVRTKSGALEPSRDLLIPDAEIGGSRDISDAYLGAVSWAGDFDFYARFREIALLLKSVLGTAATVTTTGVTTHTITPGTALPWLSVEHAIANGFDTFQYTDAKVNTFHMEADANGYVSGTFGLIARQETAGNTRTAVPTFDTTPMAVGTNVTVTYNGVTLPAKSFSFDVNNNLEDDDFRLGSFYLGDIAEKRREVTMGCTIRPQDSSLWKKATYGSGATTAPVGLTDKQQAVITISSYELIPSSTPPTAYSITITIPKAAITPFGVGPSGDDVIQHDMEIQALQPNPATPILTAVVKNDLTAIP
jgi:hypothetical protein